jgi:hypothetical protein
MGRPLAKQGNPAEVNAALQGARKTISATYELPYVRHAPIGPFLAVADVRSDGSVCHRLDPFGTVTRPARADREYAERTHG